MQNWSTNYADYTDSDRVSTVESVSTNATADDLPGPGRTLGNLYGFLGNHLEKLLNQLAEDMGRGPRVTATRIQKHRKAIAISSVQPTIRTDSKKVQKDCKRLVEYVGSGVASTRKQALDHIIDFSVSDRYVRDLLRDLGVVRTIERIQRHPTVWLDFDDSLLQRSRRALVALSDVEVNVIAKRVATLPEVVHCYNCSRMAVLSTFEDLTRHLRGHDNSFLVVRHFSQITRLDATRKLLGLGTSIMLKHLADFLVNCPDDLEWECVDRLFNDLLEETMKQAPCVYLGDVFCDDMIKTILL
ncbi:hypothetical protein M0805_001648 [Coniferiporia weirii]|nr:hypothetical protein M0805_001648 [Coniferiporia weirii]